MELVFGVFFLFSETVVLLKLLVYANDCLLDIERLNRQKEIKINKRMELTLMTNSGVVVFGT